MVSSKQQMKRKAITRFLRCVYTIIYQCTQSVLVAEPVSGATMASAALGGLLIHVPIC
jgi:hypothetical protein